MFLYALQLLLPTFKRVFLAKAAASIGNRIFFKGLKPGCKGESKMKRPTRVYVALVAAVALWTSDAYARGSVSCDIAGSYSYRYGGTNNGSVQINEIGRSTITHSGDFESLGTLHFFFPDFGGQGPLWLSLREEISGSVIPNREVPCTGEIEFLTTGTVLKSSNEQVIPVGTIFFENLARSYAYTAATTKNGGIIHYNSTSPGTIATGTAHKDRKRFW